MFRQWLTATLVVATAVVLMAASAHAETTLYGSVRASIDWVNSDLDDNPNDLATSAWQIHDNSSIAAINVSEAILCPPGGCCPLSRGL